ncbi:alpha/beta hydrolase [Beijerinckia sp. L45]|uniref:alpha/beta hydrolase n=1 Tax=Beijerinckia sp. L45 TaxID=1641855 RepID=UPI00131BCAF5|nr:alpha/beta hydrolase [Beijerinckia sp. L45]
MVSSSEIGFPVGKPSVLKRDVVYRHADGLALEATIYQPHDTPVAGVVSIHGGRWSAENRWTNARIDQALADAGIAVMAVDFRLAPSARYPAPVADINAAIRWFKAHAGDFALAPDVIGGVGTSSGGHQLLLNALCPERTEFAAGGYEDEACRDASASLAYAVACWGVVDPLTRYRYAVERNMTLHVDCHHAYFADELAMAAGNPQRIVQDGSWTHLPPLLLIQGEDDTTVLPEMTELFAKTYAEAGGAVQMKAYAGEGHTFMTKRPDSKATLDALSTMIDFIRIQASGQRQALADLNS